jgi:hypothetical protein
MRRRLLFLATICLLAAPAWSEGLAQSLASGSGGKLVLALDFESLAGETAPDGAARDRRHERPGDSTADTGPWLEHLRSTPVTRAGPYAAPTYRSAAEREGLREIGPLLVLAP